MHEEGKEEAALRVKTVEAAGGVRQLRALTAQNRAQQRAIDQMEQDYSSRESSLSKEERGIKERLKETKDAARLFAAKLAASDSELRAENAKLRQGTLSLQQRVKQLQSDKEELLFTLNHGLTHGPYLSNSTADSDDDDDSLAPPRPAAAAPCPQCAVCPAPPPAPPTGADELSAELKAHHANALASWF